MAMADKATPEGLRKIVAAQVRAALRRCDREGIAWEDFYRAVCEEQVSNPPTNSADLIRRTFLRLASRSG
jgi:hypothetical protein